MKTSMNLDKCTNSFYNWKSDIFLILYFTLYSTMNEILEILIELIINKILEILTELVKKYDEKNVWWLIIKIENIVNKTALEKSNFVK